MVGGSAIGRSKTRGPREPRQRDGPRIVQEPKEREEDCISGLRFGSLARMLLGEPDIFSGRGF